MNRPAWRRGFLALFLGLGPAPAVTASPHGDSEFSAATAETTWFGGTTWDAVSGQWEAVADSVWTFDSGVGSSFDHTLPHVDPSKDPSIHAMMEGWIGHDIRSGPKPSRWRIVDALDPRWDPAVCLSSIDGNAAWLGMFGDEADSLCYAAGQGHGNHWSWMLSKEFWHTTGELTVMFDYEIDAGPGAQLDARASWDTSWRPLGGAIGTDAGQVTWTWTPNLENQMIRVELRFESTDESDEDGFFDSSCGAVAVDNIQISGAINDFTDFESGWNGWVEGPTPPRFRWENGDWSQLRHINDLETVNAPGPCGMADSVLFFANVQDSNWTHSMDQWNLAISPWIDLAEAGLSGDQVVSVKFDYYVDTIYHNYLYGWGALQWFPDTSYVPGIDCPRLLPPYWEGEVWLGYYNVFCSDAGSPLQADVTGAVPAHAERVRLAIGAFSTNYWYGYYPSEKSNPWIDNVRVGVVNSPTVGTPGATPRPLLRAFPNPVRSGERVQLVLGDADRGTRELDVFDLSGRRVAVWRLDRDGTHRAEDTAGRPLAAGLYHLRWEGITGPSSTKLLVLQH